MKYLIESNPAFILLGIDNGEYVFYNSLCHIGARLTELEVLILDLVYTYQNKAYILSKFPERQHRQIADAIDAIEKHELLKCEEIKYDASKENVFPSEFYIHLTYRCNLRCTYCYNRLIRKGASHDMTVDEWKSIINKILPYAKRIIFTGGECLMFKGIGELTDYIKSQKKSVRLAAISNGMCDYQTLENKRLFENLSEISLSCDSLKEEGQRIGFDSILFQKNVEWLKTNFSKLKITIASVYNCKNILDLSEIQKYCEEQNMSFDKTIILPSTTSDIELMPSFAERQQDLTLNGKALEINELHSPRFRCGAGKTVCSIDPYGNVYPCQSLHYPEFLLGNLKESEFKDIKYMGKSGFCLKRVDELPVCSKCNVRYICGGGCLATGYSLYGNKLDRNHLVCHMNYYNCIEKLKLLNNRI